MKRINAALDAVGGQITKAVGTMWCAIAFALLACVSLPSAIASHDVVTIISWIAQTFLQLVLLSVIMVGQDLQSRGTAQMITETHEATMAEFKLAQLDRRRNAEELADLKMIAAALHVELSKARAAAGTKDAESTPSPDAPQA